MNRAERAVRVEHYRNKSEAVRLIAERVADAQIRHTLMSVAADYLMLAEALDRAETPDPIPASE